MEKHVFRQLVRKLFTLTNASHTCHVDLEEQVAIFLYIIVTNLSNRKVGERFQRSGNTISKYHSLPLNVLTPTDFYLFFRCFNLILNSVTSQAFYNVYIKQPTLTTPLDPYIANHPKFYPFFQDALGAVDGTQFVLALQLQPGPAIATRQVG